MQPAPEPQPAAHSESLLQLGLFGFILLIAVVAGGRNSDAAKSAPATLSAAVANRQDQPRTDRSATPVPVASGEPSEISTAQTAIIDPRSRRGISYEFAASPRDVFVPPATIAGGRGSNPYPATSTASVTGGGASPSRYYDPTYRPRVGEHYVGGYTKKDGTKVSGYYQTKRDDSFWNNYSSKGNVNPHNGKTGTKTPPLSSSHSHSSGTSHSFGGHSSGGRGGR